MLNKLIEFKQEKTPICIKAAGEEYDGTIIDIYQKPEQSNWHSVTIKVHDPSNYDMHGTEIIVPVGYIELITKI